MPQLLYYLLVHILCHWAVKAIDWIVERMKKGHYRRK